ncbi:glycosyltransferase family 2 protein [Haloarcula salina]|uniref:Glycosyltransferase family 2 protein n=1 Tax=Haloarcula salina TaxID=1429914 RepID=A0AA41KBX8_9EURY|nr:glycosyltransferase family 2 protein [Haloarcula salina]MBV0901750.1 glycosyltransferase family 2 protein [Haloarcula salina]
MDTNDSVGIVIPAYDPDILTLERYIQSIRDELVPQTIRVELDTPRQTHINQLKQTADVVNVATTRRGKGGAIMAGFDAVDTDILAFADADGSVPPDSLRDVIRQCQAGTADVSIASRRHPSSHIVAHQTVIRKLLGDAFAFAARTVLPTNCRDYQCGAKAVLADAWSSIGHHCYEPGFAWDLEFVSVAGSLGYEIAEVPVDWEDHPDSTVDPIATSLELATALVDVKRRTDAIATSPRHRNATPTDHSKLMKIGNDGD